MDLPVNFECICAPGFMGDNCGTGENEWWLDSRIICIVRCTVKQHMGKSALSMTKPSQR